MVHYIFNVVCNCLALSACQEQIMLQSACLRLVHWDLNQPSASVALNRFSFIRADCEHFVSLELKDLLMRIFMRRLLGSLENGIHGSIFIIFFKKMVSCALLDDFI